MKKLNSSVSERYAYAKNGVVFDIKTYDNGDSCVIAITSDNVDNITVNGDKLYLDSYIEDGDKCVEDTNKFSFTKTGHKVNPEKDIKFSDYYVSLCLQEMKDNIIGNKDKDYTYFANNLSMLGIPEWMFKDNGYTIEDSEESDTFEQIEFTQELYKSLKEEGVIDLALKAAKDKAKPYGYNVTNTTLDIVEI